MTPLTRQEECEAAVFADHTALFILWKIVNDDGVTVEHLSNQLIAPGGWIAFARVWRADLIDVIGDEVIPTELGQEAAIRLVQLLGRNEL